MPQMSAEEALASIQAIIIYILMRVVHSAPRPNISMLGTMKVSGRFPTPSSQTRDMADTSHSIIGTVRTFCSIASRPLQPIALTTIPTKLGRVDFGGITQKVSLGISEKAIYSPY